LGENLRSPHGLILVEAIKMTTSRFVSMRSGGFTLAEMLVVCAILLLTMTQAIPAMREIFLNTRLSLHVNDWLAANRFARFEAIKRGRLVTICRSFHADRGVDACHDAAADGRAGDDWGLGWLVFVEGSQANLGVVDPGEEVLTRQGALPTQVHGPATIKKITYNASGEPIGTIAGLHIRFNFDGRLERIICMSRTGRSRVLLGRSACS
jgi:type IV fimbrial biogenesis protein FimT